jgi:tRNA modification GTPase
MALVVTAEIFESGATLEPRRATFGRIINRSSDTGSRLVDEVVATWFKSPHSYTREDVVEIAAHGSPVVLEHIVRLAIAAGARLAEPGEFTLRAYLNGRIDLVQAEAVGDLVDAVTPVQARAAMDQLEGTLTSRLDEIGQAIFDLIARLEASIDFPDEGFHFIDRDTIARALGGVVGRLDALLTEGRTGRLIRDGAIVVIVGPPNAGKSSLFNALVGSARAIVSDVAGTTRDMVTERVDIEGLPITLVDTAGLREARDAIEAEGVKRAEAAASGAALTLRVIDGACPSPATFGRQHGSGPTITVVSKADLSDARANDRPVGGDNAISVSIVTGQGLSELRRRIVRELSQTEGLRDTPGISNVRHLALLDRARAAVIAARLTAESGGTEEMVLADLAAARVALESITGHTTDEDVLRHIFGRFCVGK